LVSLATEAWRNTLTGTSRAGLLAVVLAFIAAGAGALDALAVAALERQAVAFQSAGANIRGVAADEGMVDAAACEKLAEADTISSAGAVAAAPPVDLAATPGTSLQSYRVTPSLARLLGIVDALDFGVWMPTQLAEDLGLSRGDSMQSKSGEMILAATYEWPNDGRDSRFAYSVLMPTAPLGGWDECWAAAWPLVAGNDDLLKATVTVAGGQQANVGQVNLTHGVGLDGHAAFLSRPTRLSLYAAGTMAFGLGVFASRRRRLEHAAALHAGESRAALITQTGLETLAWATLGVALAVEAVWLFIGRLDPPDPRAIFAIQASACGFAGAAAMAGSLLGCSLTRERHLFKYFKTR
jgi:hypothetical protein